MATNSNYGTLKDGVLHYAEIPLREGGKVIFNPTAEVYLSYGYKAIVDNPPEPREGYRVEENGYTETETQLVKQYIYVEDDTPAVKPVREFSKLYLKIALMKAGCWERTLHWLQNHEIDFGDGNTITYYEVFETATTLSDDFEGFDSIVSAIQTYLGISSEAVGAILSAAEVK